MGIDSATRARSARADDHLALAAPRHAHQARELLRRRLEGTRKLFAFLRDHRLALFGAKDVKRRFGGGGRGAAGER